jgi:hypothetical protein
LLATLQRAAYLPSVNPIRVSQPDKDRENLQLRLLLLAGAASSPTAPVDAGYFERLRECVRCARTK